MEDVSTTMEESCGTTTIACEFEGGVMLGADSRTSLGTYVSNPLAEKINKIADNIYCCRSGIVSDTQAITDLVIYNLALEVADWLRDFDEPPLVYRAATLHQEILRANEVVKASFIVAGWDRKVGGQVYAVPATGVMTRQNCAVGGSGSSYILGYVDKEWRANMKKEECIEFIRTGLSLAMTRDYASGGNINIGILQVGKPLEKILFTLNDVRFSSPQSRF